MKIYEATIQYSLIRLGESMPLNSPKKVFDYMSCAFEKYPTQESFWVVCLNRKNFPIGRTLITLGTAESSLVHPREVFKIAILSSASGVVVVHNHPSGDPQPSTADIRVTKQLREAAVIVGIDFHDHVICGNLEADALGKGFYSFNESGLL